MRVGERPRSLQPQSVGGRRRDCDALRVRRHRECKFFFSFILDAAKQHAIRRAAGRLFRLRTRQNVFKRKSEFASVLFYRSRSRIHLMKTIEVE